MQDLGVFEFVDVFRKMTERSDTSKSDQDAILQKNKIQNDKFFADMNLLFAQKLEQERLQQGLLALAQEHGFKDTEEALNQVENSDGQTPLLQALQKQDFSRAKKLIDSGEEPGPIEKAAFEVALDSEAARNYGGKPQAEDKLHPVKNFGLVLGIEMTSVDGTSSQMAQVAPTYKLMTESIAQYSSNNPFNDNFSKISEAYSFTNKAAAFSYSSSKRNPEAGNDIANRIQEGKVTSIPISCSGHVMGLSVVPDGPGSKSGYLVYTNRGIGATEPGTQIFRMDDLSKVDAKFVNTVMNGHSKGVPHDEIMAKMKEVTGDKPPIYTIEQKGQKYDNCTVANTTANVHGILLCQKAVSKGGFDKLETKDFNDVKDEYKKFTGAMRADKVSELTSELSKNPKDPDLNKLAKVYLSKDPKIDASLKEKLEKALSVSDSVSKKDSKESKDSYEPPQLSVPQS